MCAFRVSSNVFLFNPLRGLSVRRSALLRRLSSSDAMSSSCCLSPLRACCASRRGRAGRQQHSQTGDLKQVGALLCLRGGWSSAPPPSPIVHAPRIVLQVEVVDAKAMKRLALSFERKLKENTEARMKVRIERGGSSPSHFPVCARSALRICLGTGRASPCLQRPGCESPPQHKIMHRSVWLSGAYTICRLLSTRPQHAGHPEKFLESEIDLHQVRTRLCLSRTQRNVRSHILNCSNFVHKQALLPP